MHVMIIRTTMIASRSTAAADPTLAPITPLLKLSAKAHTFKLKIGEWSNGRLRLGYIGL